MNKVWWKDINIRDKVYDKIGLQVYQSILFFNPFENRQWGVIIPTFNLLPQIGIEFDRTTQRFGFMIGWLNFSYRLSVNYWRYLDQYLKEKYESIKRGEHNHV